MFINITYYYYFFIIIIIIIAIPTRRPRLHSHQSDAPQYIKTLDSTALSSIKCWSNLELGTNMM
jgi:hypothetical protein